MTRPVIIRPRHSIDLAWLRIWKDCYAQYSTIKEAPAKERAGEILDYLIDFERIVKQNLKSERDRQLWKLRLHPITSRPAPEAARQIKLTIHALATAEQALKVRIARRLARRRLWPVEGYFSGEWRTLCAGE